MRRRRKPTRSLGAGENRLRPCMEKRKSGAYLADLERGVSPTPAATVIVGVSLTR